MVDDGSTDSSAAIAAAFAERDARFQLVRQPNGGLGNARNTGADRATGDYLAFVDSDDVVRPQRLRAAGRRARGDRLGLRHRQLPPPHPDRHPPGGHGHLAPSPRPGCAPTSRSTRRCSPTAPRGTSCSAARSGIDHGFRFPEGVLYEDIPVTLPAHFAAPGRSTCCASPSTSGGPGSATARRSPSGGPSRARSATAPAPSTASAGSWPSAARTTSSAGTTGAVAEQDLKYFLNARRGRRRSSARSSSTSSTPSSTAPPTTSSTTLPAIDRLKWHLVRRRLMPELLEVLRFEKSRRDQRHAGRPPRPALLRRLPVPRRRRSWRSRTSVYKLDRDELPLRARDRGRLLGGRPAAPRAASPTSPSSTWPRSARRGSGSRSRRPATPRASSPLKVRKVSRPDVTAAALDGVTDYTWSGLRGVGRRVLACGSAAASATASGGCGSRCGPTASCAGAGSPATAPGPGDPAGAAHRRRRPDDPDHRRRPLRPAGQHDAGARRRLRVDGDGPRVLRRPERPRLRPGRRAAAARPGRRLGDAALPGRPGRPGDGRRPAVPVPARRSTTS